MSSRTWLNLLLLVLLASLVLVVALKPGNNPEPVTTLTDLNPEDITQITIRRLAKPEIRLQLQNSGWQLRAPITISANQRRVNTLLQLATKASVSRYPVNTLDLSAYGLAPALTNLVLNTTAIRIGAPNAVTQRRYILVDETIHLVKDDLDDIYTTELASYVAAKLLPVAAKIKYLSLPEMELTRLANGRWQVSAKTQANRPDAPSTLVDRWQTATAQWVQTYDGLKPLSTVSISVDDGQTLNFVATAIEPQLVLARPELNLQYHLHKGQVEHLLPGWTSDHAPPQ